MYGIILVGLSFEFFMHIHGCVFFYNVMERSLKVVRPLNDNFRGTLMHQGFDIFNIT